MLDLRALMEEEYLKRHDEEIEKGLGRARHPSVLIMLRESERREYEEAGLEMVDTSNKAQLASLLAWDGTVGSLHQLKIQRIKK